MKGRKKVMRPKPIEVFQHAHITVWPSYRVFEEAPTYSWLDFFLAVALDFFEKIGVILERSVLSSKEETFLTVSAVIVIYFPNLRLFCYFIQQWNKIFVILCIC